MSTNTNKQLMESNAADWLASLKSLNDETWFHSPVSVRNKIPNVERVEKLVDVLTCEGSDGASYALIELLAAVERLLVDHTHEDLLAVEQMVMTGINRAYTQTSHYRHSMNECLVNSARCADWKEAEEQTATKPKRTAKPVTTA